MYVALAILGVAIVLIAVIEFIRVGRDIRFARSLRRLSDPKGNVSDVMHLVAQEVFRASDTARTRLVHRLLATRASADDTRATIWTTWHRMHIPAYVVRLAKGTGVEGTVLASILDGLSRAVADKIRERRTGVRSAPDESLFDDLWPISECIEELAIHTSANNHELFAKGVAAIALASQDATLHAQLGWIVNELLERTEPEASLGIRLAAGLAKQSPFSREALHTLVEYKRVRERAKREAAGASTDDDDESRTIAKRRQKELTDVLARVDPIAVAQDSQIAVEAKGQREALLQELAARSSATIHSELSALGKAPSVDLHVVTKAIGAQCDLFVHGSPLVGVQGIVRLASLRAVLAAMCDDLTRIDPSQEASSQTSVIAENVCRWVMRRGISPGASRFIAIESMESIRDHRPVNAARAMFAFLAEDIRSLDPGIAVCICEGIEDSAGKPCADAMLAQSRFVSINGGWGAMPIGENVADVRVFWREMGLRLQEGGVKGEDLPNWMNLRLDLRRPRAVS